MLCYDSTLPGDCACVLCREWSASIVFNTTKQGFPLRIGTIADVGQTVNSSYTRDQLKANNPDIIINVSLAKHTHTHRVYGCVCVCVCPTHTHTHTYRHTTRPPKHTEDYCTCTELNQAYSGRCAHTFSHSVGRVCICLCVLSGLRAWMWLCVCVCVCVYISSQVADNTYADNYDAFNATQPGSGNGTNQK